MTNLDLSSVMRRYEASRQLCLRYANLHPDEKMACGTALQKVRTLPAITHHLADLLDDMAIVLGLVPPPVEPPASTHSCDKEGYITRNGLLVCSGCGRTAGEIWGLYT